MSHRHLEEIDRAVAVARRAVTIGRLDHRERLSRFLYQRWYLGGASQPAGVPAPASSSWQTWGPRWSEVDDEEQVGGRRLVRLHLTSAPHVALHVIGTVTERARTWDEPWKLTSTAFGGRPVGAQDATVLHLPLDALVSLEAPLRQLLTDLRPFLAAPVPALTLRVARGASLAQEPRGARCFGEHRCDLVATSVLATLDSHHREQVTRTLAAFESAGVDPHRPYLETPESWDRGWSAA